jgi:hypothetical protein
VPATSKIRVFYRVSSSAEVRNINELSWIPFNSEGQEDITVTPPESTNVFKEYKYSANNLLEFSAFQLKVVLKGTISSYPPIIRDLRGIALAV